MANGIPVRLSEALTVRARTAAAVQERSLTEQVEHWARLGQAVEAVVSTATVERLKARSHDDKLAERLAFAKTPEGRAFAAKRIRDENEIRYGATADGTIFGLTRDGKRVKVVSATTVKGPTNGTSKAEHAPGSAIGDARVGGTRPRSAARSKLAKRR